MPIRNLVFLVLFLQQVETGEFEQCAICMHCDTNHLIKNFDETFKGKSTEHSNCTFCRGCTHPLVRINTAPVVAGHQLKMMTGNTGASIYTTYTPKMPNKIAVIKIHGVKSDMISEAKIPMMMRHYQGGALYKPQEKSMVKSLMKLSEECGLDHVNIKEWLEPLRSVIPGTGQRIEERETIFAEFAEGASLEILNLRVKPKQQVGLIQSVPHEQIFFSALFDLLFVQGDRHGENVFITSNSSIKLIDTRDTTLTMLDSLFLPGTFILQRNMIGNEGIFLKTKPTQERRTSHWPQLTLDYRCHVPGGAIGFNYPPKVKTCIANFQAQTADELQRNYHLPTLRHAQHLSAVAKDLHSLGFEEALAKAPKRRSLAQQPVDGYPWEPPCCRIPDEHTQSHKWFKCDSSTLPMDYRMKLPDGGEMEFQPVDFSASSAVLKGLRASVEHGTGLLLFANTTEIVRSGTPGAGAAPEKTESDLNRLLTIAKGLHGHAGAEEPGGSAAVTAVDTPLRNLTGGSERRQRAYKAAGRVFSLIPEHFLPGYK
eukprot:gene6479-7768_t